MISCFLSPTVQDELSRQLCRQPLCFTLGYPIQSTSLFDQVFSSILDHPPGPIGNCKSLLDHLVGPELSRSSPLHGANWFPYYASLLPSHEAGGRDNVVSSATTTTLQQWKIEAEVCTREAKPCYVQLAVPLATAIAPSRPTDSTQ